jgi:chromosome segregation protein
MDNRLESIELQGVKTFATLTQLEFPGKITAIVGPNGSGKSNIADAIRWVLGEQSFSLLRAKKTEDMIFSGSQQRSRAGMASTTITFNNKDGWLPIDYSHVAITRQAYRDGQNEYLLNGQKVRLKDITELLTQTGLAERTYTIIGQGLVDVALALKPDERRKLFEEAAGIGLYRSRKEEALRRLDNTRKNIDRVLDILTEIKPRLRSLERQAERSKDYQRLQSDLRLLLREWYGYQWHQKQQDLRNIRSAYQDQETRLYTLRKKYLEAEEKVEQTRTQLQSYRKKLEENHNELSANHRKLEQTTRALAIIDERQRSIEQQKSNLEIDIANLQEEITDLESQSTAFKADLEQCQTDFRASADEAKKIEHKLSEISKKRQQVEADLGSARKTRLTWETEKVQRSAHLDELNHRLVVLRDEREKIIQSLDAFEQKADQINNSLKAAEHAYQEFLQKCDRQKVKINSLTEQLVEIRNQHQEIEKQLNHKEAQLVKISTQITVLKQAESALSGYSEGSKTLVEISRKGQLPHGIEPLSQHMVVEEKFEKAISAALGELTDLLVMPSQSSDLLIQFLESKEIERVALITLDKIRLLRKKQNLSIKDGVFGYANELIRIDEPYRKLVDSLFSDIIIVRDVQTAQKLQGNLGDTQKAVTLSGLVFQANGVLISGQSPSGRRIGRTRQQNELQSELKTIDKDIDRLIHKKSSIAELVNSKETEQGEGTSELERFEHDKDAAGRKLQEGKDGLRRISEQLSWHKERLTEVDKKVQDTQSQIHSDKAELQDVINQIGAAIETEKRYNEALKGLPLFEVQQELNHWQTHQLVAKNALQTAEQRYHDICNRLDISSQRLETFQARLSEFNHSLLGVDEKKGLLHQEEAVIQQAIKMIEQEQIEPLSAEREMSEKSVSALQKLEAHSHQQVIIAERQYTQLQLELERRQDQLDRLLERIEDDLGLVSFNHDHNIGGANPLPFNDRFIEDLPRVQEIPPTHEDEIKRIKSQLRRLGAINPEAQQEYLEVKERYDFLTNQVNDLEKASHDLQEVIKALDKLMERDFLKTFKAVNQEFTKYFSRLFNGGDAKLVFTDQDNPVEGGVDIEARLPGRRQQGLALLSGGERSLTAAALIFALLRVSPPPFCILDEVDAMLDESNVGRFVEELRELSKQVQVVIITHNRNTVQAADVIYGVTMGRDSTSQMISLKLEDIGDAFFE